MTRQQPGELARLYPEVGHAGSLRAAMQVALDRAGHGLTALLEGAPGWRTTATRVGDGDRHVSTHLAVQERSFLMEFWERGVMMASGTTTDLAAAAGATGLWQTGSSLRGLQGAWAFVHYGELAEAYEQGDPVETRWAIYRRARAPHLDHALIEAAYAQPRLRALFPFTSHRSLHLSRRARPPFTDDLPAIHPLTGGNYKVAWPASSPHGSGDIGHADTPQAAIALVVAHLPDAHGPGVQGTATRPDATADIRSDPPRGPEGG